MTAIILAAGLGSRYGGLKQLDPVGPNGEFIIDYSVFDCIRSGFDKIVFIIKEENLEIFEETIGNRVKNAVHVEYAFQNAYDLPNGFSLPNERTKPWGTAHAMRSCRNIVDEKFIIFNADDFYGYETFKNMHDALGSVDSKNFVMPGYVLENTLSENGSVARGVCVTEDDHINHIREIKKIMRVDGIVKCEIDGEWSALDAKAPVSMNFWGFTPDIFAHTEKGFSAFLRNPSTDLINEEYYIPNVVDEGITSGEFKCKVIHTSAKWMGVTYKDDKPEFERFLKEKIDNGEYPENLWG
ncbi:MAG: nucleotidyltransferase [Clostridia bacterium]|nr:nucleotidyltransferase [Clostridia bacterium]